jgi:hypothetical protein
METLRRPQFSQKPWEISGRPLTIEDVPDRALNEALCAVARVGSIPGRPAYRRGELAGSDASGSDRKQPPGRRAWTNGPARLADRGWARAPHLMKNDQAQR